VVNVRQGVRSTSLEVYPLFDEVYVLLLSVIGALLEVKLNGCWSASHGGIKMRLTALEVF